MLGIFEPYQIKDLTLKNRIVMAPMCMNMATDGLATDWHVVHYSTRAIGGVGLIILEATAVSKEGRITPKDLGIWSDEQIPGLAKIVDSVHAHGGKIGIQLGHAGRKAGLNDEPSYAPSPIAFSDRYNTPIELSIKEVNRVINDFAEGARRAAMAGFDMIELHGAHGYLINQFMSPLSNKRTDAYGGSLEHRAQFLKEIIDAVNKVWPKEKPIFLRVSADEYDDLGNSPHDIASIINHVKHLGLHVIDVSSGGVVPKQIATYPGYQLTQSAIIKSHTELPTISGGLITEPHMVTELVCNNRTDLVYLGRELLRNPYWVLQASKTLDVDYEWPVAYERSKMVRKFG